MRLALVVIVFALGGCGREDVPSVVAHTNSPVAVALYAKGPWAHLFDGTIEQNYIFHVMNYAANAAAAQ